MKLGLTLLLLIVAALAPSAAPWRSRARNRRPHNPPRTAPALSWSKLEEAMNATHDTCSLAADPGPCNGSFVYWFHDNERATCRQFTWGGCGGNTNRFASRQQCLWTCASLDDASNELQDIAAECRPPPDVASCASAETLWFHDVTDASCKTFEYGGEGGNDNRFPTRESCEMTCAPVEDDDDDWYFFN